MLRLKTESWYSNVSLWLLVGIKMISPNTVPALGEMEYVDW